MKQQIELHRRLNKYILVLTLLWIATTIALLFEAHHSRLHAAQHRNRKVVQMATLINPVSCRVGTFVVFG